MESIDQTIQHFFENIPGIVSIQLFGSQVKGLATENSDVDCAVLFEREHIPDGFTLIQMRNSLSDALQKDVDLVCLNTAPPIISMQIHKHGKMIVNNNAKHYAKYSMDLYTDYFDLKMIRKPMEDAILKRRFYG